MKREELPEGYNLIRTIGSGGEGTVFLMLHKATGQLRAVKRVEERPNLLREAQALRYLRHEGLPQLIEIIKGEDCLWLVMSYVKGRTLQQIMDARHRLDQKKAVDAGLQLCDILTYLHTRKNKVLHLDLKPSNIIVKPNGRITLLDFGSALRTSEQRLCPEGSERTGTEGFAAPELYSAKMPVDERTDIYELGAVLYYLISGVLFSPACIKSHIPGCPDTLAAVLLRCLQAKPENRYGSVPVLRNELERLTGNTYRQRRREHAWAAVLMAVLCSGIAANTIGGTLDRQSRTEWDYERLLSEASCAAEEDKSSLYLRAVMSAPYDTRAYAQLIAETAADGRMTEAEWQRLKKIMHASAPASRKSYEDILSENSGEYAKDCLMIGLCCRYSAAEDLRSAAHGWFVKAENSCAYVEESTEETKTQNNDQNTDQDKNQSTIQSASRSDLHRYADLLAKLEEAEEKEESYSARALGKWTAKNNLIDEPMTQIVGRILVRELADEALDDLVISSGVLLKQKVTPEEIWESAQKFARYDGETEGRNKQRLELIDHMLGISERKENAAWERVTE